MTPQFEGNTADEVWRQAADALTNGSGYLRQDSRLGMTRELLHCVFHIRKPRQRWTLSRQPSMNPAFGIAEVVWILQGRNDAAFLNYWNPALPRFAGKGATYDGAYGHRLRRNLDLDQVTRAYEALSAFPESRQIVMQIWDGRIDLPNADGSARSEDVPCNICALPKIREGKLEWLQIMRSNDLYLGTPHNFVQFTSLQEILAGWLKVEVGSYVQVSDSLHLYEHDLPKFSVASEATTVHNTDNLALDKKEFDEVFPLVCEAMDELTSEDLVPAQHRALLERCDLPASWHNLLRIAAADAARRRKWQDEAKQAAEQCTNPALKVAWKAWAGRNSD